MHDESHEDSEDMGDAGPSPTSFVRTALVFYGVLGCVALVWRMSTPGASILRPGTGSAEPVWGLIPALAVGLGVGLLSIAISEGLTRFTSLGDALADLLGESLVGIGRADAVLLALASGLAEEMFFRGALQPAVGLVWASVIFGACHFLPRREMALWSVYAAGMGLVFGVLFEQTGRLAAPVAAHVLVNAINLPRLARRAEARLAVRPPGASGPPRGE